MSEFDFVVSNCIIRRYVRSLYEVARALRVEKVTFDQIARIRNYVANLEDFENLLKKISLIREFGLEFIDNLKKQLELSKYVENFLRILQKNRRLDMIIEVCDSYADLVDRENGKKVFFITVAKDNSESKREEYAAALEDEFGGEVELILKKDPSIIDGMIIQHRSKILDYSVRSRIKRLHEAIRRENYEN